MGKDQKIPYLNETLVYFIKTLIIFLSLNYFISKTYLYDMALLSLFSIFAAFSFNPLYLSMLLISYLLSFGIFKIANSDILLLFLYLFSVLLNTFFMILYLKIKYRFKEK
jgi:hypothetical protein